MQTINLPFLFNPARRNGFGPSDVSGSYLEGLHVRERIGSSQRYGYLFGNKRRQVAEPQVKIELIMMGQETVAKSYRGYKKIKVQERKSMPKASDTSQRYPSLSKPMQSRQSRIKTIPAEGLPDGKIITLLAWGGRIG